MQHPPPIIDYRSPATGAHRVQRVMRELEAAETLGAASVGVKLLVGIPLCLLAPLVVTVMLKRIEWRLRGDLLPGFEATFLLATALIVPLLMRVERRTRGEFFGDSVRGEISPYDATSYGEYRLQSGTLAWFAYMEIALTGPRLVWSVIDAVSGRVAVDPPLRFAAAEIAIELFDAGESLTLRQLVRPGRPPPVVSRAVQYLLRRDWIGLAARRDRVWLSTPVRERLGRM